MAPPGPHISILASLHTWPEDQGTLAVLAVLFGGAILALFLFHLDQ